jgi:transcriptional regulator GlxA family with amidase domain
MRRRDFLKNSAATGAAFMTINALETSGQTAKTGDRKAPALAAANGVKLTPPSNEPIPVAVALSEGATMIDFAGPWEVFQDVNIKDPKAQGGYRDGFRLYTVSEKTEPIKASAGMRIIPDYTFETAPVPKVVVVGAQMGSRALREWLKKIVDLTDVTMSVCTGAFQLAGAGLLSGKSATTHHDFFDAFEKRYPDVRLQRGLRFVEGPKISTAGGLTSGIDLALRVVERYFGRDVAQQTAVYMEYQSKSWMVE